MADGFALTVVRAGLLKVARYRNRRDRRIQDQAPVGDQVLASVSASVLAEETEYDPNPGC